MLWNGASSETELGLKQQSPMARLSLLVPLPPIRMIKLREADLNDPSNIKLPRIADCAVEDKGVLQTKKRRRFQESFQPLAQLRRCPKPSRSPPRRLRGNKCMI